MPQGLAPPLHHQCTAARTWLRMDLLNQLPIMVRDQEVAALQSWLAAGTSSLSEQEFRNGMNRLLALSLAASTREQNRLLAVYDASYVRWHLSTPVSVGVVVPVASACPVASVTPPASPLRELSEIDKPVRTVSWEEFCDVLGLADKAQRDQMIAWMKKAKTLQSRNSSEWKADLKNAIITDELVRTRLRNWLRSLDRNCLYQFEPLPHECAEDDDHVSAELLLGLQG